ncbi:hypothetical protein WJX81_004011 [Elliptochloris bilobata]|uniref:RRM domain-containing protein n=1 Tax=Elliptochloris bilobata TaxID=381761 RepID=A0AAW1RQG8_9CHLO
MLAHGTTQALVAENLEAFLGDKEAGKFADWLFKHLAENGADYAAHQAAADTAAPADAEPDRALDLAAPSDEPKPERERRAERRMRENEREDRGGEERSRKRERQRERIEWQGHRSGEREEDARGADKRRRDEPREERAYGRQEDERRHIDVRDGREADAGRAVSRDRDRRRERDRGARERARAVPDDDLGSGKERERDRERTRRERGRAAPETREPDRPASPHGRERRRRLALPLEVIKIANGSAEPAVPRGVARQHDMPPADAAQPYAEDAAPAGRGSVFERLGHPVPDEEAHIGRRSVFDRIRGERGPPAAADNAAAGDPGAAAQAGAPGNAIGKFGLREGAEGVVELQRKLEALQEQVRRMNAEKLAATEAADPDPRTVHVANLSRLAVPEVVAAHFSMCGRVQDVNIVRGHMGEPVCFAFVEFAEKWEARKALALSGSLLLQLPIKVTPKVTNPMHASPGYARGAGTPLKPGGYGRGFGGPPARGRAGYGGRSGYAPYGSAPGRGRTVLARNVWRRPEAAEAPAGGTAQPLNALHTDSGLDCAKWSAPVYHDLLRVGDGSGEGMLCSYFNTVGWPTTLATSEQTSFVTTVLGRKAKRVGALVHAGVTLRAGAGELVDSALHGGALVAVLCNTSGLEAASGLSEAAVAALGPLAERIRVLTAGSTASSFEGSLEAAKAQVKQQEARAFVRSVRAERERDGGGLDMAIAPHLLASHGSRLSPAWLAACLSLLPATATRSALLASSSEALKAARGAGLLTVAVPAALSKRGRFEAEMVCDGFGAGGEVTKCCLQGAPRE